MEKRELTELQLIHQQKMKEKREMIKKRKMRTRRLIIRGAIAEKVLRIAQEKNIPVERNAVLAQTLSMCQVGSYIPEETYEVLAKIFAFIKKREDEHAEA